MKHPDTVSKCPKSDAQLLEALKPLGHSFSCMRRDNPIDSYQHVIMNVLNVSIHGSIKTKTSVIPYIDAIILTRFDLKFNVNIDKLNINWNKINFAFRDGKNYWARYRKVSDLFFIIPIKYANVFIKALKYLHNKEDSPKVHEIYIPLLHLVGIKNIHFISEEFRGSNIDETTILNDPTFLHIDRNCKNYEKSCRKIEPKCPLTKVEIRHGKHKVVTQLNVTSQNTTLSS